MQSTFTQIILALAATGAIASPLAARDNCGVAPSGSGSASPISSPSVTTAAACQDKCQADDSCKAFLFGLPDSASAPTCELFAVAPAQVPAQDDSNLRVYGPDCSSVPTTKPTADHPQGQNGNQKRDDTCGKAPSGPSSNSPSPLATRTDITTEGDCIALCKKTNGCESVEVGKPGPNGDAECILFSVAASELPPRDDGATLVAYDIGC
ncbi:hypothetical protein ASPWEDRAFT_177535 [Aspergillus wentii DTO 134E9]|uniref:Apple domain-containing protein n=1 Tax=Aspergillus wentii DTO 134E9 TaxID=1073089 RepID=A0A1L9R4F3_ASPWE|nr:uncharacterized protein ASPWEDRAFT_177535 [Aspergillus wentii DTO 134E9]OJJ29796.1 hypothetical protein ASPWEDRAFT_177535 [Aspergillus wentii DTO 134E9]